MKLRIVHQNQGSREAEERRMNKGSEVMEEAEMAAPSTEDEFVDKNSPPLDPAPVSAYDSVLVSGKRKRKPKAMADEASPVFRRRRKFTASKGTLDSGGKSRSTEDNTVNGSSSIVNLKSPTMLRAEEVQSNLGHDQPTFLKSLVRSHVASCFWMGIPVPFCKLHLPMKDTIVAVENEAGEECTVKYIAQKTGLSAGWRKFVSGNKLLEGDALVFQLIGPCRFKVHIVRANDINEVDGALSLLILDSQTKPSDAEGTLDARVKKKRRPKSLPLTVVQKRKEEGGPLVVVQLEEASGNDSDEIASEVLEGSKFSRSASDFKEVKSFEEFQVLVNGVCIDPDIPEHIRRKYYELCRSKNSFLHECLLPGLYSKLAAGMIVEAVSIADAIQGCKLTTPRAEFEIWEKSLRSFELLGLNVGFIRARLQLLLCMAYDSEDAANTRQYWELQRDRNRTEDDIQLLEAKLVELKKLSAKFDHQIQNLKVKAESYELMFQGEATASW